MSLSYQQIQEITNFIYEKSGIVIDSRKKYFIESRLRLVLPRLGINSTDELCAALQHSPDPKLQTFLINAFTTQETYWFRDPELFNALASVYLPRYADIAGGHPLIIWSAACSTGQEPYSIVMLLLENQYTSNLTVRIVATDISTDALKKAKDGIYNQLEISRGLPAEWLVKYFWQMDGGSWQISESVRNFVQFSHHNILKDPVPQAYFYNIIFCRNVLIYFLKQDKEKVLKKIYKRLAPMGLLILGASETTYGVYELFRPIRLDQTTVFCRTIDYSKWLNILGR